MAKPFRRTAYQIDLLSLEYYHKWIEANPQFAHISYQKYKQYYRLIRDEIFSAIIENPSGVDLPLQMGNLSVKVLDIDFKCAEDFPKSILKDSQGIPRKIPFITSDIPKKIKITWKKHPLFKSLPSIFGVEACRTMKKVISNGVRNNLQRYEKAFKFDTTESKCEPQKPISLFDIA